MMTRNLDIEFLYLDLGQCGRCQGTDETLAIALDRLSPIFMETGVRVNVRNVHIETAECARYHAFRSSPTIRINGRDIHPEIVENNCEDCGSVCATPSGGVNCRIWRYRGQNHTAAPIGLVMERLLSEAYGPASEPVKIAYVPDLPDNLIQFFNSDPVTQGVAQDRSSAACCDTSAGSPSPSEAVAVDKSEPCCE